MEHGFTFKWIALGFGAVVVGKIVASAAAKWLGLSM